MLAAEGIAADEDALLLIARHADGGMRDALSVLDQCLSFGEGEVTAARVRQILGLVDDEVFAELLELVAERRPAGVFPLVERLTDAGADVVEFMGGAGEALRALLVLQLGGEPEGLTEAVRAALSTYRDRLQPGDVLRMLKLLAESEAADSSQRQSPARGRDPAAALDHARPDGGPAGGALRRSTDAGIGPSGRAASGGAAAATSAGRPR